MSPKLRIRLAQAMISDWFYGYQKQYLRNKDRDLYAMMSGLLVVLIVAVAWLVTVPFL